MSGRRKRDSVEILEEILRVLLEERAASKTRITNRANLNLTSFRRHVEFLVKAGAVIEAYEEGRQVYLATPRAAALLTLIEVLREAGSVDEEVVKRYTAMVREAAERLRSEGYIVRLGQLLRINGRRVFYDIVALGHCTLGLLVAPAGDPLNYVRLWTIAAWASGDKPRGVDATLVYGDDATLARFAEAVGIPVYASLEEIPSVAC